MSIYRNNTQAPDDRRDLQNIPQFYAVSASTHEGAVRRVNEDNFVINEIIGLENGTSRSLRARGLKEPLLIGVFDGTGGAQVGVAAAKMAADYATWLYRSYCQSPTERERLMSQYVSECNRKIIENFYNSDGHRGASTMVTALINAGKLYAYSLGDSRLYLYTGGKLYLVTNDHTVAMERYRSGMYTREQAQHSADRHKLTAFLGIEPASGANAERYEPIDLKRGDSLILCSDGLYGSLSDGEMAEVLRSGAQDKACDLVDRAYTRGAKDNVTCIVVDCL